MASVNTARVSSLMQPALSESCLFLTASQLERPAAEARTAEQAPAVAAHIAVLRTAEAKHIAEGKTAEGKSTAAEEPRQPVLRAEDNSFGPVEHIVGAHIPAEADNIVVEIPEPADNLGKAFDRASGFQRRTAREN